MYAMLDYNSNVVIGVFPPDVPYEKAIEEANGRTLIKVTLENSPGYVSGTYNEKENKFYPPEGVTNG